MTNDVHQDWRAELNEQQQQAVSHGDGPLLVIAGAGSGKTKTLAYRVAYLIEKGVDPERILLLTFTRRAAEEMLYRASSVTCCSPSVTGQVWGGTFHGTANRLLRLYGRAAGLNTAYTVMDQGDAADLMGVLRRELGFAEKKRRFPRKNTCLGIYSRCVNGESALESVLERYYPWCAQWKDEFKAMFSAYVTRKQEKLLLDYDDLLLYWAGLLKDDSLAERIGGRFEHLLVDEYQDTNPIQARIVTGMRRFNSNVMAVGDDAQSIYGFRAATAENMLAFPETFPHTRILKLEKNYRSVQPILESTNSVMAQAHGMYDKELYAARGEGERPKLVRCADEPGQNDFIITTIRRHWEEGIPLASQAVLFRASHLADSLEVALTRHNIPYRKYGGLRFLEAAHIKDLLGFLRVQENPLDEMAWLRILELIDGIGAATAGKIIQHIIDSGREPSAITSFSAPKSAENQLQEMGELFEDLSRLGSADPASQVARIREFYTPLLEKHYQNPSARRQDLESLEQIASGFKTRRRFLSELVLNPPTSSSDLATDSHQDEDYLVLSTIHSAKGCEWDVVFLMHASEGCLPSDMTAGDEAELEEERRLAYVAMTRARDFLYVTLPLHYYTGQGRFTDRKTCGRVSRFLQPQEVKDTFDSVYWGTAPEKEKEDDGELSYCYDVDTEVSQWIKSMWD